MNRKPFRRRRGEYENGKRCNNPIQKGMGCNGSLFLRDPGIEDEIIIEDALKKAKKQLEQSFPDAKIKIVKVERGDFIISDAEQI
jgi:hypothetical protein